MGFARTAVGVLFISVLVFYLSTVGQLTDEAKWGFVGAMAVLAFLWINLGGQAKPTSQARRPAPARAATQETNAVEPVVESAHQPDDDLPAPVTVNALDGATLRERKLAKIAAAEAAQAVAADANHEVSEEIIVEVEIEDVHVADEFVVDVSPESVEDADIEITVRDRRERHEAIRERIKRRRMGQMADIRASTARMWEDHASGEDLVALLQTPGHGHSVLVEPEHPAPGHVYGATFVRIDEGRILKLRLPLDDGFESVGPAPATQPDLPVLLDPEGNELPPLLSPDGTPLALPPLPSASSALDALRKEMND